MFLINFNQWKCECVGINNCMNPFVTPRHQKCRWINKTAQIWLLTASLSIHSNLLWTAKLNQTDNPGDSSQLNVHGCPVFGIRESTQSIWQLGDFPADARTNFTTASLKLHVPPSPSPPSPPHPTPRSPFLPGNLLPSYCEREPL